MKISNPALRPRKITVTIKSVVIYQNLSAYQRVTMGSILSMLDLLIFSN